MKCVKCALVPSSCQATSMLIIQSGADSGFHMNNRGRRLLESSNLHSLNTLNAGRPTYLRGTRCISCFDLKIISQELLPYCFWFSDIQTRGSDHIPSYTILKEFSSRKPYNTIRRTNWQTYQTSKKNFSESPASLQDFSNSGVALTKSETRHCNFPAT